LRYQFEFVCHEIGHANRKAGEERGFWTTETNFLPGRTFARLEDMNQQALLWATERMEQRPVGKSGLIPAKAFEHEAAFLAPLPAHLPAPYCTHTRVVDQYGYVAFDGNYFWTPGEGRGEVKVFQYADHLTLYRQRSRLIEYPLPARDVKNERFSPAGEPKPRRQPQQRHKDSRQEEQRLRAMGEEAAAHLDFVLSAPGLKRHHLVRKLFALSRETPREAFLKTLAHALHYRVTQGDAVQRIAWRFLTRGDAEAFVVEPEVDDAFRQRAAYQEGYLTDEPDLSVYDDQDESDEVVETDPAAPPGPETQPKQDEPKERAKKEDSPIEEGGPSASLPPATESEKDHE